MSAFPIDVSKCVNCRGQYFTILVNSGRVIKLCDTCGLKEKR